MGAAGVMRAGVTQRTLSFPKQSGRVFQWHRAQIKSAEQQILNATGGPAYGGGDG